MNAAEDKAAVLAGLRERVRALQAEPRSHLASLPLGLPELEPLLGRGATLPLGHALELRGAAAAGRTSLALRAVAAAHGEGRLAAWVGASGEAKFPRLYPPGLVQGGVDLRRLLWVCPSGGGASSENTELEIWTAVQLLRSGAFACVVLDWSVARRPLSAVQGRKLQEAAAQGESLGLVLTLEDRPSDSGLARLELTSEGPGSVTLAWGRRGRGLGGAVEPVRLARRVLLQSAAAPELPSFPGWRPSGLVELRDGVRLPPRRVGTDSGRGGEAGARGEGSEASALSSSGRPEWSRRQTPPLGLAGRAPGAGGRRDGHSALPARGGRG